MKLIILFFFPFLAFASTETMNPFPVFLKEGFSSVLEFENKPSKVVLGDSRSFQIEKLNQSIVIRPLVPYATTNMFVYFSSEKPKLFVLTASEDAEPTYYREFQKPVVPPAPETSVTERVKPVAKRGTRITNVHFDQKKDYLTVDIVMTAGPTEPIKPKWDLVRLAHKKITITPDKLWSERKEIQKDSQVKARFIFAKPNVPRDLKDTSLIIPLHGFLKPVGISLRRVN